MRLDMPQRRYFEDNLTLDQSTRCANSIYPPQKHVVNGHLTIAKSMADRANTPDTQLEPRPQMLPESTPPLGHEKVSADIPNDSLPPEEENLVHARAAYPAAHRGRDRLNDLKERNRKSLIEAKSTGAFWKQVKRLSDPALAPISVTAQALKEVFEARLNPPKTMPQSFDFELCASL